MIRASLNSLKKKYQKYVSSRYLPCTVFCRDPLVLVTFEGEFLNDAPDFLDCFARSRAKSIHVFLQFGWEHETPENSEPFAARCGLCLSKVEGASFVSIEYLLCGVPVVNAPNIGGRDELFPDFAVKTVPDTPEAVAEAVREFAEHAPDPEKIRAATIEKMKPHRETFRRLLNEAMAPKSFPDSRPFPHKLILRCTKTPLQLLRCGLRKTSR